MKNSNSSSPFFLHDLKPVYFAFPDNILEYDCSSCGAECCRGRGFAASLDRELPALLQTFPELSFMAMRHMGSWTRFFNLPGNCFFLDEDHTCSIENQMGKTTKPGICRAFPFNNIFRTDDFLIVAPHFLCPLSTVRAMASPLPKGNHPAIFKELQETGVLANNSMHNTIQIVEPVESFLGNEILLRTVCTESIGHRSFKSTIDELSGGTTEHQLFLSRAERLLGLDNMRKLPSELTDDFMLTLAPMFSLSFSELSVVDRLKALALTESILQTIFSLNEKVLSLRDLAIAFDNLKLVIYLLAFTHTLSPNNLDTVQFLKSFQIPDLKDPQMSMAAAIMIRLTQRGAPALEAFEVAIPPEMPLLNRMVLLQALGHRLKTYFQEQVVRAS